MSRRRAPRTPPVHWILPLAALTALTALARHTHKAETVMDDQELLLRGRILELQVRHQILDQQIAQLHRFPAPDQLQLQRLKREKLAVKDALTRLEDDLIPDLNA